MEKQRLADFAKRRKVQTEQIIVSAGTVIVVYIYRDVNVYVLSKG